MADAVLVNPKGFKLINDQTLPFGLLYASVYACREYEIKIIDQRIDKNWKEKLIKELEKTPLIVGVTSMTGPQILDAIEISKIAKQHNIKVVWGGIHASLTPKQTLENPNIDFVIQGEAEITFHELLKALSGNLPLENVNGLWYKKDGQIKANPPRSDLKLDDLPMLPYHLIEDMEKYIQIKETRGNRRSINLFTSRGCPHQCTFCLWPQLMYGHKFRARSADNVADEMEMLVKKYGAKEICFDDDTFTIGKQRVINICREIKKRNLNVEWSCFGRVGLDEETLREMKQAGCEHIRYGVESGSQELLNRCKKFTNIGQIKETFKLTKKVGIRDYGTFMFGLPGENWKTVNQTIKLAKELDPYAVQFSIVIPFPGTEYYQELKEKGMLKIKDWSDFDGSAKAAIETEELSKEDLEKALALAWKEFYLRPSYVIKSTFRHLKSPSDMKSLVGGARSFLKRWSYYRKMLK